LTTDAGVEPEQLVADSAAAHGSDRNAARARTAKRVRIAVLIRGTSELLAEEILRPGK
jgi:tRNA(Met) C34 N-acetyltransferase TmcA